ncbi:MAG: hypothetical protein ACK5XN_02995, partial [Bacteroidota bacterium]
MDKLTKNLSRLLDQTNDGEPIPSNVVTLTDPVEIAAFWRSELESVEKELPSLFEQQEGEWVLANEKTDDIDFIRLSAQYGTAISALKEFEPIKASEALLPFWLFALRKYFWRASNYVITLQHYAGNPVLKKELLALYRKGKNYESYRYHLVTCLTYQFSFSDRELRDFYKLLQEEKSALVQYAWYRLLIHCSHDPQLMATLKTQLSKSSEAYLKVLVLE